MKIILEELNEWFENLFIKNMPGRIGKFLRRLYWGRRFLKASNFTICEGCVITAPGRIDVGEKTIISRNCCLFAHNDGSIKLGDEVAINIGAILGASEMGEIVLGNNVLVGFNVVMRTSNHSCIKRDTPIKKQGHKTGKITIEDDVWIGSNAVILPNVTIGKGAIIGAGAIVNKSIPSYALAGGVPAKVLKENCRI